MNITETIVSIVKKIITNLMKTIRNHILLSAELVKKSFRESRKTELCKYLPAGTNNFMENRVEKDFYEKPIRICRKSL